MPFTKKPEKFQSEVINIIQLTNNVKHFTISVPKDFNFIPGQYISIIKDNPNDGIKLRRPYSIVSKVNSNISYNSIDLCIKILENGNITPLLNKLKKGDKIECLGPLGNFKISEESKDKNTIFISTGVGIAPFISMIEFILEKSNKKHKVKLITGYKTNEDILYEKELKSLENKHSNFKYYSILSESDTGNGGRVQKLVEEHFDKNADYYICGLKDMISSVRLLILKKGVLGKNIYSEKYD